MDRSLGPGLPLELSARYVVRGLLGKGAMGVVYRAHDPALNRDVAIKLVFGRLDPQRRQRFEREGQITAALDHPGIVRVHSAGLAGETPYLACELVPDARTLDQVLPGLDLRAKVAMIRDVAAALGHAHAAGIVHRDVKPDNVLVDAEGRARVGDFGLATARNLERMTATGALLGTPVYMSPELIAGERAAVGPHSDVWALGVMLYEALAGALPFVGVTLVELASRIAAQPIPPLPPHLPADLSVICQRALERDPARRFPDGLALADALGDWLEGRKVRKPRRAWPRTLAAAGLVMSGVLLAQFLIAPPTPAETETTPLSPSLTPAGVTPSVAPTARAKRGSVLVAELKHGRGPVRAAPGLRAACLAWGEDGAITTWSLEPVRRLARQQVSKEPIRAAIPSAHDSVWLITASGLYAVGAVSRAVLSVPHPSPKVALVGLGRLDATRLLLGYADGDVFAVAEEEPKRVHSRLDAHGWEPAFGFLVDPQRKWIVLRLGTPGDKIGVGQNALAVVGPDSDPRAERPVVRALRPLPAFPTAGVWLEGKRFLVGTEAGGLTVFGLQGGSHGTMLGKGKGPDGRYRAHQGPIVGLVRHPAYGVLSLAATAQGAVLRRWDIQRGLEVGSPIRRPRTPTSLALSRDGRHLLVGTTIGVVEVWRLK